MKMEYLMTSRVAALQALAPRLEGALVSLPSGAEKRAGVDRREPWYARGLRPIENEIDVFLNDEFVWLGY